MELKKIDEKKTDVSFVIFEKNSSSENWNHFDCWGVEKLRKKKKKHFFQAILFFGIAVASYAVSLALSLLFEAPMVSLLRIVHPLRQWKQDWHAWRCFVTFFFFFNSQKVPIKFDKK